MVIHLKALQKYLNNIHRITYITLIIVIETAILAMILSVYFTFRAQKVSCAIYYLTAAHDLIISVKDLVIEAIVYAAVAEFIIRHSKN